MGAAFHCPANDTVTPFSQKVPYLVQQFSSIGTVVFTCQYSAHRAPTCANWYREKAHSHQRVAVMSGGFRAWEGIGLPVRHPAKSEADSKQADAHAIEQGLAFAQQAAQT